MTAKRPGTVRRRSERPILFSGPMVRAILADRKTQTRRVANETPCRYGLAGDRLWVRETWYAPPGSERRQEVVYRADYERDPDGARWRPSLYMPRWASRITLEITDVRVQRLQDISEEDALAEGTPCWVCGRTIDGLSENDCECFHSRRAVGSYQALWDSINGKRPGCAWTDNPWVWAISFRRADG